MLNSNVLRSYCNVQFGILVLITGNFRNTVNVVMNTVDGYQKSWPLTDSDNVVLLYCSTKTPFKENSSDTILVTTTYVKTRVRRKTVHEESVSNFSYIMSLWVCLLLCSS